MKLKKFFIIAIISLCLIFTNQAYSKCQSPQDFIKKIQYMGNHIIRYELSPNFQYKKITVVFFGRRGQILRYNTIVNLKDSSGEFKIPAGALTPPPQAWFNFLATDNHGCEIWGLINFSAIEGEKEISIDDPSGEGHAFLLSSSILSGK